MTSAIKKVVLQQGTNKATKKPLNVKPTNKKLMTSKLKIKVADITSGSTLLIEYSGILYATIEDYLRVRCDDACTTKSARDELYDACRKLAEKLTEETKLSVLTYLLWTSLDIDTINHPTDTFYAEKSHGYDSLLDLALDGVFKQVQEEAGHD